MPVAVRSHVDFEQNWYCGSQSAFDVHEPNDATSASGLPESLGAPMPVVQLATVVRPPEHVDDFGGKLLALHVETGEPPPPHVCNPAPHAQSPLGNLQQIPSDDCVVEPPGKQVTPVVAPAEGGKSAQTQPLEPSLK